MSIDWTSWILEKNATIKEEELKKADHINIEALEKQKYLPQYDTAELVKPQVPKAVEVPTRQKFLEESVRAAQQGRIPQSAIQSHADKNRASAIKRVSDQNQRAQEDYKTKMNMYNAQADARPKNVVSGHRLHGNDSTGAGSSVAGTNYQVMTDYPDHIGKESHLGIKHAHNDLLGSKLRIRDAKNHVLVLRRQGDNTAYHVHVTPEQYSRAMMTGWHDDSNKS